MDLKSVLQEVETWPVEDRLQLVQEVWDRLIAQGHEPELTEELKVEFDRRLAEDDAAPDDGVPWEEVLAEAKARLQK